MCMRTFISVLAIACCVSLLHAAVVRPVRVFQRVTRVEQLQSSAEANRLAMGLWNEASGPSQLLRRAGFNAWLIGGDALNEQALRDASVQSIATAVIPVYAGPQLSADRSRQWLPAQQVSAEGLAPFGDLWSPRLAPVVSQRWNDFLRIHGAMMSNAMVAAVFLSAEDGASLPMTPLVAAQPEHLATFWAGGEVALAAFRNAMRQRYVDVQALNTAWNTQYSDWAAVQYPSPGDAGWPQFVGWYQNGLSYALQVHVQSARRQRSALPLLLPVGGASADRRRAVDLSAQVRAAARNQAAAVYMGFTKGAQCPYPELELALTASAARHFGSQLWLGPPADALHPDLRLFRALSEGCLGVWERQASAVPLAQSAIRLGKYLQSGVPIRTVSVLYPSTDYRTQGSTVLGDANRLLRLIREHTGCGAVDERMIQDGALASQRLLVAGDVRAVEPATRAKITEWIQQGGVLLTFTGAAAALVTDPPVSDTPLSRPRFVAQMTGTTYTLQPGVEGHRLLLAGSWGEVTPTGGRSVRSGSLIKLPLQAGKRYEVAVDLELPAGSARPLELFGDQSPLGQPDTAGRNTYRYLIPESTAPRVFALSVRLPNDLQAAPSAVMHSVTVRETDASVQIPGAAGHYRPDSDWNGLTANWSVALGAGKLVTAPAGGSDACIALLARIASVLVRTPDAIGLSGSLAPVLTCHAPDVEVALLPDRLLLMNHGGKDADVTIHVDRLALQTFGVHAAATGSASVRIAAGSCAVRSLGLPDADIYLQCERFTSPGSARAVQVSGFAPGPGVNALRLDAKVVARTAFQSPRAGVFRVYVRSISQGVQTPLDLSVNGRSVTRRTDAYPDTLDTVYVGDVSLMKGINTLELRNSTGREVTADFVILTSRDDVAGFVLSTRPADP